MSDSDFIPYDLQTDVPIPNGWQDLFMEIQEQCPTEYQQLRQFLLTEQTTYKQYVPLYPPKELLFHAFVHVPTPMDLKVVILGQDPYHQPGQAMGLSFSIPPDCSPLPPSLRNIFKNIQHHTGKDIPTSGDLTNWAQQGVLLLNTALTVRQGNPNCHQQRWAFFTDYIIQWISDHCDGVVFMLWGKHAQKKQCFINEEKHLVLTGLHPSPLSNRGSGTHPFIELTHFLECNNYLQQHGKTAIMW